MSSEQEKPTNDDEQKETTGEVTEEEEKEEGGLFNGALTLLEQLKGLSVEDMRAMLKAPPQPEKVLSEPTLEAVAEAIKEGKCRKVVVMAGAGISVAAGIPDFRSPGTGLYDNLQKYNLPHPTAVFELDYFKTNPKPFYTLAKELYPGSFVPTPAHHLVKLLHDKGVLLRAYTQNIDGLERIAGVPDDKIIEAHGSFHTAHCIQCRTEHEHSYVKGETGTDGQTHNTPFAEMVFSDQIPKCRSCQGLVKPDIVFFGESLPARFFGCVAVDFQECDLLIVMGTSLQVQPFASLVQKVSQSCPRLLINRESVGEALVDPVMVFLGMGGGFKFGAPGNVRDVRWLGDVQQGAHEFVKLLGWEEDFQKLLANAEPTSSP